ncbi:hypothetical protein [Streptomyces sp. TBY4]|uniref:hypothetical protein n=1 Tax=Streptomyces sp. TBY4 TaxID=2962030 RepID=UPI0020B85BCD|nr:hypothetical protein [Streptomyces sp. TBY4]MCP3760524.1 hypothetical protein [Streptomyces sp. TBY4]
MTAAIAPAEETAVPPPTWTARPLTEADHDTVFAFFDEADFHFRTAQPDTRSEADILALLDEAPRLLLADGVPVGLWALEACASEHWAQLMLHFRLTSTAPLSWWQSAFDEVVRAVHWRRELVRLSVWIDEHDARGLAFARAAGLTDEGVLSHVTLHEGRRYGTRFFSRIWAPTS